MNISKIQWANSLVLGAIIFTCYIISSILLINLDSLVLFTFFLFIGFLLYNNPNFIIRYVMIFFMCLGNIIGVFICENTSLYLSELDIISFYSGSFPLLALGWFVFLFVLYLLDTKYQFNSKTIPIIKVKFKDIRISVKGVIFIAFALFSLILIAHVGSHPFFLEGIDRFQYQQKYLQGYWQQIIGWASLCIPIILLLIIENKSKLSATVLGIYLLFLFMTGEKFGGFWNVIVIASIVYSIYGQTLDKNKLFKVLGRLFFVFICLLIVLFVHRGLNYNSSLANNTDYFLQRMAQQGQLWWKTYDSEKGSGFRVNELQDETRTYFEFSDTNVKDYNHAIYKIMRVTTPEDIFDKKIESGSRYSTSTFATMYYYFKEIGVLGYAVIGAVCFWLIMRAFMYSVANNYLVELYISGRLLFDSYAALTQSEFNLLFSYKSMVYIGIFLFLYLLRQFLNKKRYISNELTK